MAHAQLAVLRVIGSKWRWRDCVSSRQWPLTACIACYSHWFLKLSVDEANYVAPSCSEVICWNGITSQTWFVNWNLGDDLQPSRNEWRNGWFDVVASFVKEHTNSWYSWRNGGSLSKISSHIWLLPGWYGFADEFWRRRNGLVASYLVFDWSSSRFDWSHSGSSDLDVPATLE